MTYFSHAVTTIIVAIIVLSCANKAEHKTEAQSIDPIENSLEEMKDSIKNNIKVDTLESNEKRTSLPIKHIEFQYDISRPENTFILPQEIIEISGIGYDKSKKVIYAVNDEEGKLYTINPTDGKILDQLKFGKRGDYEGIESTPDGNIYAIKSNGNMVEIAAEQKIKTIKTDLRASNDVEGLGYLPSSNSLLLACKGYPNLEKGKSKSNKIKSVFTYSLTTSSLSEEPFLQIEDKKLIAYFDELPIQMSKAREKKLKKRLTDFSPSGIAYNTEEELFYILSSVGKTLITIDENSEIHHVEFLDNTYFVQPEGICFDEKQNLFISNEGKGLVAKLMKFERK